MKCLKIFKASFAVVLMLGMSILLFATETLAADNSGDWRATYDLVLRWLNFVILASLLVKFGKNPLMNILRQRKQELQREINKAEEQKKNATAKTNEVRRQLEESVAHLEEIKQRIIKQGETRKKEIIQEAQAESTILLKEAKRRMDSQILSTRKMFQTEMVDEAIETVFEKLPQHITPADYQKFLDQYLLQVSSD